MIIKYEKNIPSGIETSMIKMLNLKKFKTNFLNEISHMFGKIRFTRCKYKNKSHNGKCLIQSEFIQHKMSIKVINLNRLCYRKALDIQQKLFQKVKNSYNTENQISYLLMVEHDPVYTIGIRQQKYIEPEFQQKLIDLGADFVPTNRGGLITFHGPGQLVVYPIINMTNFPVIQRSIKKFVCLLESVLINVCKDFSIDATRVSGLPGVWVDSNRKIGAIGIHASKYVTMHGIALNCNVDLNWFKHIIPCGIENKETTSITNELNTNINIEQVSPLIIEHFTKLLECELH